MLTTFKLLLIHLGFYLFACQLRLILLLVLLILVKNDLVNVFQVLFISQHFLGIEEIEMDVCGRIEV